MNVKSKKISGFLAFSGGMERNKWHEMGSNAFNFVDRKFPILLNSAIATKFSVAKWKSYESFILKFDPNRVD